MQLKTNSTFEHLDLLMSPNDDKDYCPGRDDHNNIMKDWSCADYNAFVELEKAHEITGYSVKTIQILVFTYLISVLYYRKLFKGGKIGKLTIFIAFLVLINGFAAVVRFYVQFEGLLEGSYNHVSLPIAFFVESFCFYGAMWLFAMRFYEAVYGMECVLTESGFSSATSS